MIGILALQGSYDRHLQALQSLGTRARLVHKGEDLETLDGLIIPGGESTTQSKLARDNGLFEALRQRGRTDLAVFGTCAGAILIGRGEGEPPRLDLCPVWLDRNAYGRQIDSFTEEVVISDLEAGARPFHCVFIRAPRIRRFEGEVLARLEGEPILVRSGRHLLATFHPELTGDLRIHKLFVQMVDGARP